MVRFRPLSELIEQREAPHGGGARGLFAFVARLRLSGRLITAGFMVTQCGFRWANLKYGAFLTAHGDSNGAECHGNSLDCVSV